MKLTMREIKHLQEQAASNEPELNAYVFQFSVNDLYSRIVGEMQLSPNDFWAMTADEVELAYRGYLNKLEIILNGIRVALLAPDEEIQLADVGWSFGSVAEQQQTLSLFEEELNAHDSNEY